MKLKKKKKIIFPIIFLELPFFFTKKEEKKRRRDFQNKLLSLKSYHINHGILLKAKPFFFKNP